MGEQDRRRHPRTKIDTPGWIEWTDEHGLKRHVRGRCLDISSSGLQIALYQPIPAGVTVNVGIPKAKLDLTGVVRHCLKKGHRYAVGLEFSTRNERRFSAYVD